jgi:hypothetical protein
LYNPIIKLTTFKMKKELKPYTLNGNTYQRIPVKTHLIHIKEPLMPIIQKYVISNRKKGDWIAISEKFVTISEGRVIHKSAVKPGLLAKLIVKGVRKYDDDIGYSSPYKMQVAIWQAGWFRAFCAMVIGGLGKLIGRHGDFYRIAGNRISEIDGFNPAAMPPFNEFAMLGPSDPEKIANHIEKEFGIPTVIIDGNNINVEVLGRSKGVPVSAEDARLILLDNPMGQNDELTPIVIIREGKS